MLLDDLALVCIWGQNTQIVLDSRRHQFGMGFFRVEERNRLGHSQLTLNGLSMLGFAGDWQRRLAPLFDGRLVVALEAQILFKLL